jgi:ribulose-phosphate 3-epimerase
MIADPLPKLGWFVDAGASMITFQLEGTLHPRRALQSLAGSGVLRGVAVGPGTPVELLAPLLDDLELVLLVTIDPGWSGQDFDAHTGSRLAGVRRLIADRPTLLGIDGAVNQANLGEVAALGPDLIVSGSAVFDGPDPVGNARSMLEVVRASARMSASAPPASGHRGPSGA